MKNRPAVDNGARFGPRSGQQEDMLQEEQLAVLIGYIRGALRHLYDPVWLRGSPLLGLLGLESQEGAVGTLQDILREAIEALGPEPGTPPGSHASRVYHVLSQRFVEGLSQREVSNDLGFSVRQLRREEKRGLQLLSVRLCESYQIDLAAMQRASPQKIERLSPSRERELQRLQRSQSAATVSLVAVVRKALSTLSPFAEQLQVEIACDSHEASPHIEAETTSLRQALLSLLAVAVKVVPNGEVRLEASDEGNQVRLDITSRIAHSPSMPMQGEDLESLRIASDLVGVSGGRLHYATREGASQPFTASLLLPSARQVTVLAIDDNADTLRLMSRYLGNTRYRLLTASNAKKAIEVALDSTPDVILLDIMMPAIDGWELLARLREHPRLQSSSIVVCSILSQETFARILGAAAFLQKPFSRQDLLDALDGRTEKRRESV